MFSFVTLATIALSAASAANAVVIPRATAPSDYRTDILEPYDTYHTRYMAINCLGQHNTAFFDACCHPLKKGETLEKNRKAECNPANKVSSSAAQPTATADDDDEDCEEEDEPTSSAAPAPAPTTVKSAAPTSSVAVAPVNVAPEPSSEAAPTSSAAPTTKAAPTSSAAPTTKATPTEAPAKTTKTSSAAAAPTQASSSEVQSGGFATFFFQNGVAGACGKVHGDDELIAAIDERRYGNAGNQSGLCGKKVEITNPKNGKSVTVTIADDCPTCTNSNSIDLSVGAFKQIATEAEGMVGITWKFV